jgi:hypothetical protein
MMLVGCVTKLINGSQLMQQISYAIGVRFYLDRTQQDYVDLKLYTFSW